MRIKCDFEKQKKGQKTLRETLSSKKETYRHFPSFPQKNINL